jgi:uncharacterized protein (TIGR02246 family)
MPMTALDYEEIRQLAARYVRAVDFGDADAFAACFTPGGSIVLVGQPPDFPKAGLIQGTADLRRLCSENFAGTQGHVRHWNSPPVIEGDGETATMSSYLAVMRVGEAPLAGVIVTAVYWDTLVKVGGRWLFAERQAGYDPLPEHRDAEPTDFLVVRRDQYVRRR